MRCSIAGNGSLTQQFTGQRGQGDFSFDQILFESGKLIPGKLVGSGQIVKTSVGSTIIEADSQSTYNGDVVIQQGSLLATGLPQASFVVAGGVLQLPSGANSIELAGGELRISQPLSGPILVTADSRISTEATSGGNARLSGSFTGSAGLTLGRQIGPIAHELAMSISGNSPDFSGPVQIDSAAVTIRREQSLGNGDITVLAGGRL